VVDLRLVGAYPLGDTGRILDALAGSLPIRVNRRLPWWVTVEPLTG
jgi:transmembrane sensor